MLSILFGNNWGGRCKNTLLDYVDGVAPFHDVLGFSEVNHLSATLPAIKPHYIVNAGDHEKGYLSDIMVNQFHMLVDRMEYSHRPWFAAENAETYTCAITSKSYRNTHYGNALFVSQSNGVRVIDYGEEFILGSFDRRLDNGSSARIAQYAVVEKQGVRYVVVNYHGVWYRGENGDTKGDGPLRDEQSEKLLALMERLSAFHETDKVILGGDLNLDMNTNAVRMLTDGLPGGRLQFQNVILDKGITSTRTKHYRSINDGVSLYADYVFASTAVEVMTLDLMGTDVSDHLHLSVSVQ